MYYASMTFELSIAHRLGDMPAEHKCSNLHGHNLEVTVEVGAMELNERGFVIEFGHFRGLFDSLVAERLDHGCINECLTALPEMVAQPTAERLAEWIAHRLEPYLANAYDVHVYRVDIRETRHAVASYIFDLEEAVVLRGESLEAEHTRVFAEVCEAHGLNEYEEDSVLCSEEGSWIALDPILGKINQKLAKLIDLLEQVLEIQEEKR